MNESSLKTNNLPHTVPNRKYVHVLQCCFNRCWARMEVQTLCSYRNDTELISWNVAFHSTACPSQHFYFSSHHGNSLYFNGLFLFWIPIVPSVSLRISTCFFAPGEGYNHDNKPHHTAGTNGSPAKKEPSTVLIVLLPEAQLNECAFKSPGNRVLNKCINKFSGFQLGIVIWSELLASGGKQAMDLTDSTSISAAVRSEL